MSRITKALRRIRSSLSSTKPAPRRTTPRDPAPRKPNDYVADILKKLRTTDFELLRTRFPESSWHKYLNIEKYVPVSVSICKKTGLIGARPRRILDIGCGTGLFLYCARHFGHDGVGTDIETGMMAEMAQMLGVERRIEAVLSYTPIGVPGTFDLITCMGTQFDHANEDKGRKQWGTAEWLFFLSDLESHLTDEGRVFLRINRGQAARAVGKLHYNDDLASALKHGHLHGIAYLFDRPALAAAIKNLS